MCSQQNHTTARGRSWTALFLVVLTFALLLPFIGNAEGEGGVVPNPIPPPPNGEGQSIPDTTFLTPDSGDSTFYYVD